MGLCGECWAGRRTSKNGLLGRVATEQPCWHGQRAKNRDVWTNRGSDDSWTSSRWAIVREGQRSAVHPASTPPLLSPLGSDGTGYKPKDSSVVTPTSPTHFSSHATLPIMQNDFSNNVAYHPQYTMNYHHHPQTQQQAYPPVSPTTAEQLYNYAASTSSSLVQRRRSGGSRRASPETLISLDAPTQPRRYLTPSATSRKDVPAFFSKRGTYSRVSDEEEDELHEEPPAPNATDQEKIEWKRRQNTLAARRSRKRKLLQQQALEEQVEELKKEKEVWRTRALTLRQLLLSHGILCPDFKD